MTRIELENRVWLLANHEEKNELLDLGLTSKARYVKRVLNLERCMLMFDYDRDMMQPPEPREELDPSQYIYVGCGQYRYVGDEV